MDCKKREAGESGTGNPENKLVFHACVVEKGEYNQKETSWAFSRGARVLYCGANTKMAGFPVVG